jgi:hypothetical protein
MIDAFRQQFGMSDSASADSVKNLRAQLVETFLSWKNRVQSKLNIPSIARKAIGENIRRLRKECGWNQETLAFKARVIKGTVNHLPFTLLPRLEALLRDRRIAQLKIKFMSTPALKGL